MAWSDSVSAEQRHVAQNDDGTIDCALSEIYTIFVDVYDQTDFLLKNNDQGWECELHSGVLDGVTAGSGLKVVISCEDADGNLKARGEASDISVVAGQTTYISQIKVNPVGGDDSDDDNDGYTEVQDDCDDNNSAIYPGAQEICGNAIDEDCNGSDETCDVIGVTFSDSNLESVIRKAVNQPTGNISSQDLANIIELDAGDSGILHLEGIQYCKNLEELRLDNNSIEDISLLANLVNLNVLHLRNNLIEDISPLSNLVYLTYLYLDYNSIKDISPLSSLVYLTHLYLGVNSIEDISLLSNLVNLTDLRLNSNSIEDINPLSNLSKMKNLRLGTNRLEDIGTLSNLFNLVELYLNNNRLVDIGPLSSLSKLQKLVLSENKSLKDISPLSNLHELRELLCAGNIIEDISPLVDNAGLRGAGVTIDITKNSLSSDSCNTYIPQLELKEIDIEHSCN
jgi:Leucine-rich repeat (LRR) protein